MNESFNVAPGGAVESYQPRNKINQIYDVWVDNFSSGWLAIEGRNLWVPPYTRGWKATIFPGMSSITVRSYDFANGVRIAGATGQAAIITIWDEPNGDSDGIAFFDQQTVPTIFRNNASYVSGGAPSLLVAAPAIGRIRIYEIRMFYQGSILHPDYDQYGVAGTFYGAGYPTLMVLEIAPAKPSDVAIFVSPAGDLPIGVALQATFSTMDIIANSINGIQVIVRYTVI